MEELNVRIKELEELLSIKKREKINYLAEIAQLTKENEKLAKVESDLVKERKRILDLETENNNLLEKSLILEQKEKKISELEEEVRKKIRGFESAKKILDEKIAAKEDKIKKFRIKINNVILEKDEKIKKLSENISEKDAKIKDLDEYLEMKIEAVNSLHEDLEKVKEMPKILEKMKKTMKVKGFLNEKELEALLS